jgi:hypothetical protein
MSTTGSSAAPSTPTSDTPEVTATVTGVFMQDYVLGTPVTVSQNLEILYTAGDGTQNIYSPVGFGLLGAQPAIARIYPSPTSMTGWAIDQIVLPPEPHPPSASPLPTAVIVSDLLQ